MFDKNVLHLAEVLEKWSTVGYPCLDEKDFADEKVEYARLYFAAKEGDEQAKKTLQYLDSKLSLPLLTNFDVKKQMVSLLETYGRVTPRQAALFNQLVQEQKVVRYIPEFCDISYLMKEIDNDTKQKYQMKTDEVLNEVLSVDVYPNKKLAELLKDNLIIFYYTEHDSTDAAMASIFQNGKRRPVMILDRGLLREDNKELLVGIMCHELGHWLDDSSRPDNFYGEIRLAEKCFADLVGFKMCQNAGYNPLVRFYNYQKFVKECQKCMMKIILLCNLIKKERHFIGLVLLTVTKRLWLKKSERGVISIIKNAGF